MVGVNRNTIIFLSFLSTSFTLILLIHFSIHLKELKVKKKKIKFQCHVKIQIPQIVDDDWILSFGILHHS